MDTVDTQKVYSLSREAASKLLKISIRTLDRYIKAKKVASQIIDGRIWLDKDDIKEFKAQKLRVISVDSINVSTSKMSIDNMVDNIVDSGVDSRVDSRAGNRVDSVDNGIDNVEIFSQDSGGSISNRHERPRSNNNETYKHLFLELKEELKEKQERLEIANYRVGQLEAQLSGSIPLLEYHHEKYENKKIEEEYRAQLSESANMLKRLSLSIKYEKFSKRIFLIILLTILALQPLWLLFYFNT